MVDNLFGALDKRDQFGNVRIRHHYIDLAKACDRSTQ
jgi:hypothetical protein